VTFFCMTLFCIIFWLTTAGVGRCQEVSSEPGADQHGLPADEDRKQRVDRQTEAADAGKHFIALQS